MTRASRLLATAFALLLSATAAPADGIFVGAPAELDGYLWVKRPVVVFADTPDDPRYVQQMEMLQARPDPLAERDVIVLTDTDPEARGPLRRALRPRGFSVVLVGKDGRVELRKPAPWDVRELTRVIDKLPLRQQELREARQPGAG
ncbi:DUF4174 domain-containing protein [Mangrovicoccus algicola]|uniref:DUF4174 domain-containing protein n=1 Tax=Mangrovicoccus algicola TaxID=2771008 RepID=A0A8J6YYI0_9RHOB|nr:DUF4174 domain-containing protein [Mangrovicoccus algicola]MBE3640147.1 DUF4174 domain-containing protein [Mangrovicoccus algicola]